MEIFRFTSEHLPETTALFERTFSASEGASEGKTIAKLVDDLVNTTRNTDLAGYNAIDSLKLCGSIFFSALQIAGKTRIFMLSPVAVSPEFQRQGVGQKLIRHGLQQLKNEGVDIVVTYGDPDYYCKTGFEPIGQNVIEAPYALSYPHGWQAVILNKDITRSEYGKAKCVEAFRDPAYW